MDASVVALITSRLESIDRSITEERRDSAESRRRVYQKLDQQGHAIAEMWSRVEALEKSMNEMSPTVAEFVTRKTQVVTAGKLGLGLWKLGGVILTAAAGFAGALAWLQGFFTDPKP